MIRVSSVLQYDAWRKIFIVHREKPHFIFWGKFFKNCLWTKSGPGVDWGGMNKRSLKLLSRYSWIDTTRVGGCKFILYPSYVDCLKRQIVREICLIVIINYFGTLFGICWVVALVGERKWCREWATTHGLEELPYWAGWSSCIQARKEDREGVLFAHFDNFFCILAGLV